MSVHIIRYNFSAQNSPDNLPSYPPDNHHSSDNCLIEGRRELTTELQQQLAQDTNL